MLFKGTYMSVTKFIMFFCMVFLVSHCIEPYKPKVIQTDYGYLVVEGMLIQGDQPTVIRLSRTQSIDQKQETTKEAGAFVRVEDESGNSFELTNDGDGTYSVPNLSLDRSKNYRLRVFTPNEREYASEFVSIQQSPDIDEVTWTEDDKGLQFFVSTHDPANLTNYYLWTFDETWEYSSLFYSIYKLENGQIVTRQLSNELYYCWRSEASHNIFLTNTFALRESVVKNFKLHFLPEESRKLIYGYSLLVKQHALTKEAYEYWETLKKNNESLGSIFDRTPSQDFGNLRCVSHPDEPVLGYFSATTIGTKRIFVDRQDVSGPHFRYEEDPSFDDCIEKILPLSQLNAQGLKGYLLIDRKYDLISQELVGYSVATTKCVDCREHGGSNLKPDFWP